MLRLPRQTSADWSGLAAMEAICNLWLGIAYDGKGAPYRRGLQGVADVQHLPRHALLRMRRQGNQGDLRSGDSGAVRSPGNLR
jgi:hypothetical protein